MSYPHHARRRRDTTVLAFWVFIVVVGLLVGLIAFLVTRMWMAQQTTAPPLHAAAPAGATVVGQAAQTQPVSSGVAGTPATRTPPPAGRQTFEYLSVEVLGGQPDSYRADRLALEVRTCVVKLPAGRQTVEITPLAWTLRVPEANPIAALKSSPFTPSYASGDFAEGQCNQGFVAFDTSTLSASDLIVVEYSNSFGDEARWDLSG